MLKKILKDFLQIDLFIIANLLQLDIDGTKQETARKMFIALSDVELFYYVLCDDRF